jgi:hypothetical protein
MSNFYSQTKSRPVTLAEALSCATGARSGRDRLPCTLGSSPQEAPLAGWRHDYHGDEEHGLSHGADVVRFVTPSVRLGDAPTDKRHTSVCRL